jgi:IMP cyclohydrolase
MVNPNGPYPGRQLFLGLTVASELCLVYIVTGRSTESRQRKAVTFENTVRIGPVEKAAYDPLRHYTALKYDNHCGVAAVSNGIQTEAVYETYRLLCNVGSPAAKDYMQHILDGADAEPDSLHTPRIAGVVVPGKEALSLFIGIKTIGRPAVVRQLNAVPGKLSGISTYRGSMDNPQPRDPAPPLSELEFSGETPQDLATNLYDISAADCKGFDIRVCAVAAIHSGAKWEIAIINKM